MGERKREGGREGGRGERRREIKKRRKETTLCRRSSDEFVARLFLCFREAPPHRWKRGSSFSLATISEPHCSAATQRRRKRKNTRARGRRDCDGFASSSERRRRPPTPFLLNVASSRGVSSSRAWSCAHFFSRVDQRHREAISLEGGEAIRGTYRAGERGGFRRKASCFEARKNCGTTCDLFCSCVYFPPLFLYKPSRLPRRERLLVPPPHLRSLGLARRERDPPRSGKSPHLFSVWRVEHSVDDGALASCSCSPREELDRPSLLELVERVEEVLPAGPGELGGEGRDGPARVDGRGSGGSSNNSFSGSRGRSARRRGSRRAAAET